VTLSRYLCSGVTSIVALGAVPWERAMRDHVNSTGVGPRVFIAGGIIGNWSPDSGQPIWDGKRVGRWVPSPAAVTPLLDSLEAERIDLVKAAFSLRPGTVASDLSRQLRAFVPALRELVRESHVRGYRVAMHATELASATAALEAGVDFLAHPVDDTLVGAPFL